MDYLSILSFVPKIAFLLLVLTASLILIEVFYFKKQKGAKEGKVSPELKQALSPLKFNEEKPSLKIANSSFQEPRKKFFLSVALFFGLLIGLLTTLFLVEQKQEIRKKANEPSPEINTSIITTPALTITSTPIVSPVQITITPQKPLEIKVYKISGNKWLELKQEELSQLKAGAAIKIATAALPGFKGAVFKVNGKIIEPAPAVEKNPFGEFYIDYVIARETKNFLLEVELLKD